MLLFLFVHLSTVLATIGARLRRDERGQATAEYALVLLGAAAIALLLLAWGTSTGAVSRLLDAVLRALLEHV